MTVCAIVIGAKEEAEVLVQGETRCAWLDESPKLTDREEMLMMALRSAADIASGRPGYGSDLERFCAIRHACDSAASLILDQPPVAEPFTKEVGRQHALERAVCQLPREDRGRLLRAYYERPRRHASNQITCVCGEVLNSAADALEHFTGHQEWKKAKA